MAWLPKHHKVKVPLWFRGHAAKNWKLVPAIARKRGLMSAELNLMKKFRQNAIPHLVQRPKDDWEWLFLMQHYRLPTRLLDWTESPLVALYFAVREKPRTDGALWCLLPTELNKHANIEFPLATEIPAFDHDEVAQNYLPLKLAAETTSKLNPLAAIALRNSPRMAAQLGAFTITHREPIPIENVGNGKHVWQYVIPAKSKTKIRQDLGHLRITKLTLFPELESVAEIAQED